MHRGAQLSGVKALLSIDLGIMSSFKIGICFGYWNETQIGTATEQDPHTPFLKEGVPASIDYHCAQPIPILTNIPPMFKDRGHQNFLYSKF